MPDPISIPIPTPIPDQLMIGHVSEVSVHRFQIL